MTRSNETYSISEVCKVTGLSRSSILYYEKIGLVSPQKNAINGYREFSIHDLFKLKQLLCLSILDIPYMRL